MMKPSTHLALGTLVRRRGEVDKAIRIHQNVLARKDLTRENKVQAELELARDYLQAGLHDRAEHLLDVLVNKAEVRRTALGHLLEIYQRERDWKQAEEIGQKLLDGDDGSVRIALAHFLCERCDEALMAGELRQVRVFVERAMDYQRSFRVALTFARVEFESKNIASRFNVWRTLKRSDRNWLQKRWNCSKTHVNRWARLRSTSHS